MEISTHHLLTFEYDLGRNMRVRAEKVEQLKKQLRAYEIFHPNTTLEEDSTYEESCIASIPPNKRGVGGWCSPPQQATPPAALSGEGHPASDSNYPQFSRMQQQVCLTAMEQQSTSRPRAATRPRMECWAPTSNPKPVRESPTAVPSLPMEGEFKPDGILPLSSPNLPAISYEDFAFDMTELVNKSRQSTSLLHIAVAGNHIDTIKVLLQDERVMIDDKDSDGFTPLQRAVMQGRSEIVKLLLEHSASTEPVRGGGDLPLGAVGGFGTNISRSQN